MRQLAPLVAATAALAGITVLSAGAQSAGVVLEVRPTRLAATQNALLIGAVSSGRAGEKVTIQAKDCGLSSFRNVLAVTTGSGGRWQLEYRPFINAILRATWRSAVSAPVAVRQAPGVHLDEVSPGKFRVGVGSKGHMWRKRVAVQRRVGSRWERLRMVVVTETYAHQGSTFTETHFSATLPAGTLLRAVLPADQARPCYLPGVSRTIATQG